MQPEPAEAATPSAATRKTSWWTWRPGSGSNRRRRELSMPRLARRIMACPCSRCIFPPASMRIPARNEIKEIVSFFQILLPLLSIHSFAFSAHFLSSSSKLRMMNPVELPTLWLIHTDQGRISTSNSMACMWVWQIWWIGSPGTLYFFHGTGHYLI